jgi:hypothetical protein
VSTIFQLSEALSAEIEKSVAESRINEVLRLVSTKCKTAALNISNKPPLNGITAEKLTMNFFR